MHGTDSLDPPFISTCETSRSQAEHTRVIRATFLADTLLEEDTTNAGSNLAVASFLDLATWYMNKSAHWGFCLNISGDVTRTYECPCYEECVRDERRLHIETTSYECVSRTICMLLSENTTLCLAEQMLGDVLKVAGSGTWTCILHKARWADSWKSVRLLYVLGGGLVTMIKCTCLAVEIAHGDDRDRINESSFRVTTDAAVTHMQNTYHNLLHAASVARGCDTEDCSQPPNEENSWKAASGEGHEAQPNSLQFTPCSMQEAIRLLRGHYQAQAGQASEPDGVD